MNGWKMIGYVNWEDLDCLEDCCSDRGIDGGDVSGGCSAI